LIGIKNWSLPHRGSNAGTQESDFDDAVVYLNRMSTDTAVRAGARRSRDPSFCIRKRSVCASPAAQALMGKTVAIVGAAMYSQHRCVKAVECLGRRRRLPRLAGQPNRASPRQAGSPRKTSSSSASA